MPGTAEFVTTGGTTDVGIPAPTARRVLAGTSARALSGVTGPPRALDHGGVEYQRPAGPATRRQILTVLTISLNAAAAADRRLIPFDPARRGGFGRTSSRRWPGGLGAAQVPSFIGPTRT